MVITWHPARQGDDPIEAYVVTALSGGKPQNQEVAAAESTTLTMSGLVGGSPYQFSVAAMSECGTGPAGTSRAVTPSGAKTTYASAILASEPLAFYRFSEANGVAFGGDSSGHGHLVTYGQASLGTSGALVTDPDTAVHANATCCVGSASPSLPQYDEARSVEAWVQPADGGGRWIAGWGSSAERGEFDVGIDGSDVFVYDGSSEPDFALPYSLTDGSWHQIVVTYDGSRLHAYLDGQSLGSRTIGTTNTVNTSGLVIGASWNGGSPLNGNLDELSVYKSVLSPATVAAHFAASGHSRPGAPEDVAASYGGKNSVQVTWGAPPPTDPLDYYIVQASTGAGPANSVIAGSDETAAVLSGLPAGVSYTFTVVAVNAYGRGPAGHSKPVKPTGAKSTYASDVLASNPLAYYRFSEAEGVPVGADSSGQDALISYHQENLGEPGALVSDPDTAVHADGQCCVGYSSPALPQYNEARSVEAWVQWSDSNGYWIAGWGRNEAGDEFDVGVNPSQVFLYDDSTEPTFQVPYSLNDGAWHQIVVTYDGSHVRAFVDGQSLGVQSFGETLDTLNQSGLVIGASRGGSSPFNGNLDDLSVYPGVLSAATVAEHFAASGHSRPPGVKGLTAKAGTNEATVSWTPPGGADPVTRYIVTAVKGGTAQNQVVVAGDQSSTVISGLAGGQAYNFSVVAVNAYGQGPASVSSSVTPSGAKSTYASVVLASKPIAYYRFSEAAGLAFGGDSSGDDHQASYANESLGQSGAIVGDPDTAVQATGSCCVGYASPNLPQYNSPRTVEFWVQWSDGNGYWITGWGRNQAGDEFDVGVEPNGILAYNGVDEPEFTVPYALNDGNWHQIVVTYDGSKVRAYADGKSRGAQAFSGALDTLNESGLVIGALRSGGGAFHGNLDELSIYKTALSATAVASHFKASGQPPPRRSRQPGRSDSASRS